MLYSAELPDQNNNNFKISIQPMTFPLNAGCSIHPDSYRESYLTIFKAGRKYTTSPLIRKKNDDFLFIYLTMVRDTLYFFLACSQTNSSNGCKNRNFLEGNITW